MVDAGAGWGRKAKAGFYAYDDKGKRAGPVAGIAQRSIRWQRTSSPTPIDRAAGDWLMVQALEAVRALEQGVLEDIREGDVGAILGWGFAPWSGGPFSWLDMLGTPYAAERCDQLTETYGARFATPDLLREMAAKGQSFYGRFGPQAQSAA